jgi:hypothetical protein
MDYIKLYTINSKVNIQVKLLGLTKYLSSLRVWASQASPNNIKGSSTFTTKLQ